VLAIDDRPVRLCDGLSRRRWLEVGSLAAMGLALPALLGRRRAEAAAGGAMHEGGVGFGKARSCIVLFLMGGPPQHETWDPKPEAPDEVRGDLKPIASSLPGLWVGELMPRTASLAHKVSVLRAVSTKDNAHSSSGYFMLTGTPHQPMNSENATPGAPNNWPCLGAVVNHLQHAPGALPGAVTLPENIWNTGGIVWPGQDAGWLGRKADPWLMTCDPSAPGFQVPGLTLPGEVPPLRFEGRRSLLESVSGHLDAVLRSGAADRFELERRQAFDLLASPQARQAFELDHEPAATRDRYGRNRFGQSVLLARRLVEAGVSLVQVNWTRTEEDKNDNPVWDTHTDNTARLKTALMPPMDLAYSALLEDLDQRGLLDETLVIWMGEFGRTPKINARAGRDHWGYVFSMALAGGGIRAGQVHGASDALGAYPKQGEIHPEDLAATVFHCLGYAPHTELVDPFGRPMVISRGRVLDQLF
jgi:hypothetical protein